MKHSTADRHIGQFEPFYCVALVDDLPEFELKAGDVGTIVEAYSPNDFTVEFTAEGGYLAALLDIQREWLRVPTAKDLKNGRKLAANEFMGAVTRRPTATARNP